jgi:hypothetical protein
MATPARVFSVTRPGPRAPALAIVWDYGIPTDPQPFMRIEHPDCELVEQAAGAVAGVLAARGWVRKER